MNELRHNFEKAVDAYADELLAMWSDYDEDPRFAKEYSYWAGNDMTGVFCYADDVFINLADLIYCVDNKVSYETYCEWTDYCVEAAKFGFTQPNLDAWVHGCPRVPEETFERLHGMKDNLDSMVEIVKHNPEIQF